MPGISWRKSKRSAGNGECVEIAELPSAVLLRDSKNPQGPTLRFDVTTWRQFIDAVRSGALDCPDTARRTGPIRAFPTHFPTTPAPSIPASRPHATTPPIP